MRSLSVPAVIALSLSPLACAEFTRAAAFNDHIIGPKSCGTSPGFCFYPAPDTKARCADLRLERALNEHVDSAATSTAYYNTYNITPTALGGLDYRVDPANVGDIAVCHSGQLEG